MESEITSLYVFKQSLTRPKLLTTNALQIVVLFKWCSITTMQPPIQHTPQKSASILKLFANNHHEWINKSVLVEVKQNILDRWQNRGRSDMKANSD